MEILGLPKRAVTTLVKMADTALEFLPISGAPSETGAGRKIFFPIPLKNKPECAEDFLYVYAESKLDHEPKENEIGFTEDDIQDGTGVYYYVKKNGHGYGKVYSIEALFREVFTDIGLQNRITYKLNQMKEIVRIDGDFLAAANHDLANRPPGVPVPKPSIH